MRSHHISRFVVAAFVGATIAATVSTSASAYHCLARSPTVHRARPSASYLKGRSQFLCAAAYTAAVGLVAKSYGAAPTRLILKRAARILKIAQSVEPGAMINCPKNNATPRSDGCRGVERRRRYVRIVSSFGRALNKYILPPRSTHDGVSTDARRASGRTAWRQLAGRAGTRSAGAALGVLRVAATATHSPTAPRCPLASRGAGNQKNKSPARMRAPVARRAAEILAAIAHAS